MPEYVNTGKARNKILTISQPGVPGNVPVDYNILSIGGQQLTNDQFRRMSEQEWYTRMLAFLTHVLAQHPGLDEAIGGIDGLVEGSTFQSKICAPPVNEV